MELKNLNTKSKVNHLNFTNHPIVVLERRQTKCNVGNLSNVSVGVAVDSLEKIRDGSFWIYRLDLINLHFALDDDAVNKRRIKIEFNFFKKNRHKTH